MPGRAFYINGFALSVSHSLDRFPFLSLARHLFLSLSPVVTFLPGAGRICPGRGKSFLKVGAFGSPCKVYLYAKASPFGRGGTEGDGEGEDAGLVLRLFEILTITECIIFVKTICWNC